MLFRSNFVIRKYDEEPDVAIYSSRFPVLFPNGRNLEDDIAGIACNFGDCVLVELANANSRQFPRQTVNDKPFQAAFPYLADPWPSQKPPPPPAGLTPPWQIRIFLVLAAALGLLILYLLISGLRAKYLLRQQQGRQ